MKLQCDRVAYVIKKEDARLFVDMCDSEILDGETLIGWISERPNFAFDFFKKKRGQYDWEGEDIKYYLDEEYTILKWPQKQRTE